MERRHFKLPNGYVNVDDVSIAFTRSGNWTEAEKATERSASITPGKVVRFVVGVCVVGVALVVSVMKIGHGANAGLGLLVPMALGVLGFLKLWSTMKDGFVTNLRIPFAKVRSVQYHDCLATIEFVNARWKEDRLSARMDETCFLFIEAALAGQRGSATSE